MSDLTRPIIGIENRTAQEVFDIMSDRIRRALSPHGKGVVEQDHGSARDHAQATGGSCGDGLLPCPFCGSADIDPEEWLSSQPDGNGGEIIRSGPGCGNCSATAESVERWNTRPIPSHDEQAAKGVVPGGQKDVAEAVETVRRETAILVQQAEGCAFNHHAGDVEVFGLPGWLTDAKSRIEGALEALSRPTEGGEAVAAWQSCGPKGVWRDDPMGFDAEFRTKTEATGLSWRPLYAASPATPSGEIAGLREAVARVVDARAAQIELNKDMQSGKGVPGDRYRAVHDELDAAIAALSQSPAAGEG